MKFSFAGFILFLGTLLVYSAISLQSLSASEKTQEFTIPPYILNPGPHEATIAFQLDQKQSAQVVVTIDGKQTIFTSEEKTQRHNIVISGLEPGQAYPYQVIAANESISTPATDDYRIKTASQKGDSFHFAVFGDPRPGETGSGRHHRAIINEIAELEPSFYLVLGDMVDDGTLFHEWQEFFDIESPLMRRSAIYPVLGDNDIAHEAMFPQTLFPLLEKGYYRFDWGGVQFFGLNIWGSRGEQDKEEFSAQSEQMRWLNNELKLPEVQNAPFRVVFLHDPVRISRGRAAALLEEELAPILEENNVDLVFSSWHLYERSHHNGVTYVISGGAGAELIWMDPDPVYKTQADARNHHYCRVDVNPHFMTLRAVSTDGTILDEFTLTPKQPGNNNLTASNDIAQRLQKNISFNQQANLPNLLINLFSYDCSYCRRLLDRVLPNLAEKYRVTLEVAYYDLSLPDIYPLFLSAGQSFGRQDSDLPAIFIGNKVLGGDKEIQTGLENEIRAFSKNPASYIAGSLNPFGQQIDSEKAKANAFSGLTVALVATAGFLDGFNPCAFATVIMLVSYLAMFGANVRTTVWVGISFIAAVFTTYIIIGLFFHHTLRDLLTNSILSTTINSILLMLVIALGLFSLFESIRMAQGKTVRKLFQLPSSANKIIERLVRNTAEKPAMLILMPPILGVLVSGLEFTCTGQVYVPIVTMLSEPEYRLNAFGYLLVYNLAFIGPLVAVFLAALMGSRFMHFTKNKVVLSTVRIAHSGMFFAMAIILTYNLGWF